MSKFVEVESFGVDDGELDGLTPAECFTLGVEWEMVRAQLKTGDAFEHTVHVENRDRIAAMVAHQGRVARFTFMENDVSESWLAMEVKAEA